MKYEINMLSPLKYNLNIEYIRMKKITRVVSSNQDVGIDNFPSWLCFKPYTQAYSNGRPRATYGPDGICR